MSGKFLYRVTGKEFIAIFLLIGLSLSILVLSVLHMNLRKQYLDQSERYQATEMTLRLIQNEDIQVLISHVKHVMSGEIIYERGNNPLSVYSYNAETYPSMHTIDMHLSILEIYLDGDKGEITALYGLNYRDVMGNIVRSTSAELYRPARWILERKDNAWIIVEIDEYP